MRKPKGTPNHQFAPKEWRNVPNITGSVELDRVIKANPNKDMVDRLEMYAGKAGYGGRSAYNGYRGYSGDE